MPVGGRGECLRHRPAGSVDDGPFASLGGTGERTAGLSGASHHATWGGGGPADVPATGRGEASGDQVLVCGAPDRAGRLLLAPPGGASGAVATLIRLVRGEHGPPTLGQPRKFRTCYRQQRRGVSTVCQFGEHVEAFPHRVAQDLAEYLVHGNVTVTFPPARRLLGGRPATGPAGRKTGQRSRQGGRRAPPCSDRRARSGCDRG